MEGHMFKLLHKLIKPHLPRSFVTSLKLPVLPGGITKRSIEEPAVNCLFSRTTVLSTSSSHLKKSCCTQHRPLSSACSTLKRRSLIYCLTHSCQQRFYTNSPQHRYSTKSESSALLQDHSALQVRRQTRKKIPKTTDENETLQKDNVVAYAVAEEIDLKSLEIFLIKQGLYAVEKLPSDVTDVIHVRGKYNVEQKPKEIFVFEDGSVVFWCIPEVERSAFIKVLTKFAEGPYISSLVLFEREEMDFVYVNDRSHLQGETIHIKLSEEDKDKVLEMYSFSNAMAQSVKLAIWESSLNKFVSSIEDIIEDLRKGHKIGISRRQILMKIGELFSLRHLINLSSDLLDTPDFYWDRQSLEPLYRSLYFYLNIAKRTRVINEKINHCCELTDLVNSHLNDAHHTRLELMIIILILVEVLFACARYAEKYFASRSKQVKNSPETFLEPHFTSDTPSN
ncbi:required for meiotic nuclear division protein 1 [Biomphalaria pfeifferi]|uniref:Required for meiotic nuclear division protein 1 n=1 Tax=Biomphalaria pfeifferi TaxID=112525 RepID=A0AAD8B459_BIOPF|nr:required for meiotic nuclear division protein 1 [Biomphalaria pfeifferi]